MAKKVNIQVRIKAISKELANGARRKDILEKFSKKWKVKRATIDNYIKEAKKQAYLARIQQEKAEADAKYEADKEAEKMRLLDRNEKRNILAKIARLEMEIPTKKPVWDSSQKKYVMVKVISLPEPADIMKAIDLDNKMEGDYAPTKNDVNLKQPVINFIPAEKLTENQINELLNDGSNDESI